MNLFQLALKKKIADEKLPYEVINAGVSGDTSASGLQRLDYWITRSIDVFVLELGINDVIRGVLASVTLQNLDAIIARVKSKYPNARLALMGMELPAFINARGAAQFRLIFKTLADKYSTAFVPFFLDGVLNVPNLNLHDGLHPSAAGYKIIADHVWPTLRPLLKT